MRLPHSLLRFYLFAASLIFSYATSPASTFARESVLVTPPPYMEATLVALLAEDVRADAFEAVKVVGPPRGECTKLPAWTTLAGWSSDDGDGKFTAPARQTNHLRPVCLMPLPFKPDAKGQEHLLAE